MRLKKLLRYFSFSIILSIFISTIYLYFDEIPNSFDNRLRDYFFTNRGEIKTSDNVVIVDIDEESLKDLGQWPWSRNKISKILTNLVDANAAIIGIDVVFSEEDKSFKNSFNTTLLIKSIFQDAIILNIFDRENDIIHEDVDEKQFYILLAGEILWV